eukprot:tig00020531_g10045.t1
MPSGLRPREFVVTALPDSCKSWQHGGSAEQRHLLRLKALAQLVGLISKADCRCPCCWKGEDAADAKQGQGTRTTEPREHGQVAAATCSVALLAARREAVPLAKKARGRPPGSFSRRPAQRVPFTRGWHLALLAAGARTASASSSPSATGGDGAAVTVTPPFSRFSLPRCTAARAHANVISFCSNVR